MKTGRSFLHWLLAVLLLVPSAQVSAVGQTAAKVEALLGSAEAVAPDQARRALKEGDAVFVGDRVQTGESSRINLRFGDKSHFEIGPRGVLVVDRYSYAQDGADNNFATRILGGTFRFVTGLIAKRKPEQMQVGLTVATIGIRGTHVAGEVQETAATVILLEPEDSDRPTAVQVANQFGSVTIDQPGYGTDIPDQYSPPSPVRKMQVRQIQDLLRSLRSIQRPPMPRPR